MNIPTVEQIAKWQEMERDLNRMARRLKCGISEVADRLEYLFKRIEVQEARRDQLQKEIFRLKGFKPLSKEFIEEHNRKIREGGGDVLQ